MFRRNSGPVRLSAVFLMVIVLVSMGSAQETALDRYVAAPDPSSDPSTNDYWELIKSHPSSGLVRYGTFIIRLTSQRWRSPEEVGPTEWQHWLRVIVPTTVTKTTALLLINGGTRDEEQPGPADFELGVAAAASGAVIAELRAVPNQPLQFTEEAAPRSEDAIIAYSWDRFLRGGDEQWPAQLPMTKAAVRAMDAVQAFLLTPEANGPHAINDFIVTGGSKRGWTTWLTAAVDDRVKAIVPVVFDALNLQNSFMRHWQSYGEWSEAVHDYEELGIFGWFGSGPVAALLGAVDPYSYLDRLTMPKYLINASGDEFFANTSWQFYFDDLEGEKYLRYVPNASHDLAENFDSVLTSAVAWALQVVDGEERPQFDWQFPSAEQIVLTSEDAPSRVRLWQATNPNGRDFRVDTLGDKAWASTDLAAAPGGQYEAQVQTPPSGYTAFFVEMEYPGPLQQTLVFTTPVRVVPDTLPFGPPLATRLAASFHPLTAADAIASVFGVGLSNETAVATRLPLPTELAGTTVEITDANGVVQIAQLFFVSPNQVNILVPLTAAPGVGLIEVKRNGQRVAAGQILIEELAPGLFSANGNGEGVAAAVALTVKGDGSRESQVIFDADAPEGSREPERISAGRVDEQVYLLLFGTGMRMASEVVATIGDEPVPVAGPAPSREFEGVDQVNLGPLPLTLNSRGEVEIRLVVDGIAVNPVTVLFD